MFGASLVAALLIAATAIRGADIDIVREGRLSNIVGGTTGAANIAAW
jgi:hypothetical protein